MSLRQGNKDVRLVHRLFRPDAKAYVPPPLPPVGHPLAMPDRREKYLL